MNSNKMRKVGVGLLTLAVTMGSYSKPVLASTGSSVPGKVGFVDVSGSVSISSEYAQGVTSSGCDGIHGVKVTFYYEFGKAGNIRTVTEYNSAGHSVSATAYTEYVPCKPIRATAVHSVTYNGASWSDTTQITYRQQLI